MGVYIVLCVYICVCERERTGWGGGGSKSCARSHLHHDFDHSVAHLVGEGGAEVKALRGDEGLREGESRVPSAAPTQHAGLAHPRATEEALAGLCSTQHSGA